MFDFYLTPFGFWYGFVFLILFSVGVQSAVRCYFFLKFTGAKQRKINYLLFALFDFMMFGLNLTVSPMSEFLISVISVASLFAFIQLLTRRSPSVSAFLSLLLIAVNILVESIITPLFSILIRALSVSQFVMTNISVFAIILLSISVFSLYTYFFKLDGGCNNKSLWLLSTPLLFICIVFRPFIAFSYTKMYRYGMAITETSFSDDIWFLIISLIAVATVGAILFSHKKVTEQFNLEKEAVMLNTQLSMHKSYVEEIKQRYDSTKRFRHDFNNHISVLGGLIKENDFVKAQHYLSRLTDCYEDMSLQLITGNTTLDILISEKLRLAKQFDIEVKADIDLSNKLGIDDFDLCAIFANALDNSIKACKSLEVNKKRIDITAKPINEFYIIDIINNFDEAHYEKGHGMGLTTIKMIAQKYRGYADVSIINNEFRLSIILPIS